MFCQNKGEKIIGKLIVYSWDFGLPCLYNYLLLVKFNKKKSGLKILRPVCFVLCGPEMGMILDILLLTVSS